MTTAVTRRQFLARSAAAAATGVAMRPMPARAAQWQARQVHAQPADSHLQRYLSELWNAVRQESAGRLDVTVYPSSMGIADAGPVVLQKVAGAWGADSTSDGKRSLVPRPGGFSKRGSGS